MMANPLLLAAALLLLLHAQAFAASREITFCSEPVIPFCVESDATYEDELETKRCRSELENYVGGLKGYADCLKVQQQEANERGEELQSLFDCRASGKAGCRKEQR
jgi:hypothetical protein